MFKSIVNFFRVLIIRISLALYETEHEILKSEVLDSKGGSIHQRKRYRNRFIEMMLSGVKDEKVLEEHYEILKKSDRFMKESTPYKQALAADKHGMNYAKSDRKGHFHEHLGFYDEKHKHSGKTVAEVLAIEYEERKTKDDHYELLNIYDNTPIEVGLIDVMSTIEKVDKEDVNYEYKVNDLIQHSKKFKFPIRCSRENQDILNKIEQLSESLHIKKIGFDYIQLEFFIPLKFGTNKLLDDSDIFKDLINISQVFVTEYNQIIGFGITGFKKRIIHNDAYEVWKFDGIKMETVKLY